MADPKGAHHQSVIRAGVTPRIIRSWKAPRSVFNDLRGMPDNALLAVLMAAMLILWVAQVPAHSRAAQLDPSIPLEARLGGAFLAVMFMMPILCYLVATVVSMLSNLTAWRVTPLDSRLALFWSLLAVAPAMLLLGLVAGLIGSGPALELCQILTGVAFLLIWGSGLWALSEKK